MVAALGQLNARHDVACVHLLDSRTRTLPDVGLLALEDAETGEIAEVDTGSASVRAAYAARAAQRLAETESALARASVDTLRLEETARPGPALARFFERRRRRR